MEAAGHCDAAVGLLVVASLVGSGVAEAEAVGDKICWKRKLVVEGGGEQRSKTGNFDHLELGVKVTTSDYIM